MTPEKRYEALVKSILAGWRSARIGDGKGFGWTEPAEGGGNDLRHAGERRARPQASRVIAALELVASGDGKRFDAGKGRPMREWLALFPTSRKPWLALAEEAMAFVSGS